MNLFEHANLTSGLVCAYCPRIEMIAIGIGVGLWLALMIYLVMNRNRIMKDTENTTIKEDANGNAK
jgi:mannose/fructose/N-acetylgalactosamine-specific phosphotransferase system component IIC